MDIIFLLIAAGLAVLAIYLIGDFLFTRLNSKITYAVITEFQGRKSRGLRLPVVAIEDLQSGKDRRVEVSRIDSFTYLFGKFEEGDTVLISYKESAPGKARIYGYMNVVAGLFLLAPLLMALAGRMGNVTAIGQVIYFTAFGVIMIGAWFLMKMVQKNY